jgi:hypothetical protein
MRRRCHWIDEQLNRVDGTNRTVDSRRTIVTNVRRRRARVSVRLSFLYS